jgi:hypothetical protein
MGIEVWGEGKYISRIAEKNYHQQIWLSLD